MRQRSERSVPPVAALVFLAGCATTTPVASPSSLASSPATSAAPTAGGSVSLITVFKVWDADGNANTTDDRETIPVTDFPPDANPVEFGLDVEAFGGAEPVVSTVQPEGTGQAAFQIESEGESVMATVTEVRKDDSTLIGGHCFDAATQAIVMGMTGGDAVTFEVPAGASFGCTFINTPVPELGAGE